MKYTENPSAVSQNTCVLKVFGAVTGLMPAMFYSLKAGTEKIESYICPTLGFGKKNMAEGKRGKMIKDLVEVMMWFIRGYWLGKYKITGRGGGS